MSDKSKPVGPKLQLGPKPTKLAKSPSSETPRPKLNLKPPKLSLTPAIKLKVKEPVLFDVAGIPQATRANVDRMTLDEVEQACRKSWTMDKHINPLLVQLGDLVEVSAKASKHEKCQAVIKYKKSYPSGLNESYRPPDKDVYEAFSWQKEIEIRYRGQTWILPHSTKFKREIITRFSEYRLYANSTNIAEGVTEYGPRSPFLYQMFVVRYLGPKTPYRSLLAYHELGSGKTRTSILVSREFIADGKKVLVLLPGALRINYYEELYRWGPAGVHIPDYDSLKTEEKREKEKAANRVIDHYYDILTYNERGLYTKLKLLVNQETGMLENRLIIIDEVHDFVSRMANPSNQSRRVYHFLMDKVRNCKFLGLSGTPLLNTPYEMAVLYNVFRGRMGTGYTLFPEQEEDFNNIFVNYLDRSVMNQQLFQRRISGMCSYYPGATDFTDMPEKVIMPTDEIEMSDHQYKLYLSERYSESKKEQQKNKAGRNASEAVGSAFRTYSRMVSNFSFPEEISRPKPISVRDFKSYERFKNKDFKHKDLLDDIQDEIDPSKLEGFKVSEEEEKAEDPNDELAEKAEEELTYQPKGDEVLTKKQRQLTYSKMLDEAYDYLMKNRKAVFSDAGLKKYSPKMLKIYERIKDAPGNQGIIYIYTEFRILEGVRIMGAVLENYGFERIDLTKYKSIADLKKLGPKKRYGVISSEEDSSQRKILQEIARHPENAHGEYLKVIMGTSASSQGINLFSVTQVHIMEPYWNMVRNHQVIGRAVRFHSHTHLPKEEQKVYVYTYRMKLTSYQASDIVSKLDNPKEVTSTEEYVHRLAIVKDYINTKFLNLNKAAAVDSNLNYLVTIIKNPDLVPLDIPEDSGDYMYYPDINQDPTDYEFQKNIKYENFVPAKRSIGGRTYGFKAYQDGKPMLSQVTYKGKVYAQVVVLYDYDLLVNNIEVKRKYYILGVNKLIDVSEADL